MTVTAEGFEVIPVSAAATMFSLSATFQTWIGATGTPAQKAATALARVYEVAQKTYTLPCILLDYLDSSSTPVSPGTRESHGTIQAVIIAAIDASHNEADAARMFLGKCGKIMAEFAAQVGAGCLNLGDISRKDTPKRPQEVEHASLTNSYYAAYQIEYWGGV